MTTSEPNIEFNFDNTYARSLTGFYTLWEGEKAPDPQMVRLNLPLAKELGLDASALNGVAGAEIFSGSRAPKGADTLAQIYAGHQFGGFSPQLGDGRALLLGEVIDIDGNRRDIHLKGSGRTPFSRGGDGKAALGPILREYIIGEAMHALNIPTTRALAVVTTGEDIMREAPLPGAVLARIAASHIRVGTFQYFAARGELDKIKQLADYVIARHYPHLEKNENPYLSLLSTVCDRQAFLIAKWMLVGFVHGVMNTDNMTVSGETIDYGPCAFIDNYDPNALFSSIDGKGRYAYKNQPQMAHWNLTRLAETLLPLINEDSERAIEKATSVLEAFPKIYGTYWLEGMRAKLGLTTEEEEDFALASDLLLAIEGQDVDYTNLFRSLADLSKEDEGLPCLKDWLPRWHERCAKETVSHSERNAAMNKVNPIYIPRNHLVEEALTAAVSDGDCSKFETLMETLEQPFETRSGYERYAMPAPQDFGPYKTYCGT
ncbi:MAG: YdiU family protein [Rhizobiaceae bacterium]|nr:YdiU family protein [Rhizobiaceae bacterium]